MEKRQTRSALVPQQVEAGVEAVQPGEVAAAAEEVVQGRHKAANRQPEVVEKEVLELQSQQQNLLQADGESNWMLLLISMMMT
jgi:hypothetical protein